MKLSLLLLGIPITTTYAEVSALVGTQSGAPQTQQPVNKSIATTPKEAEVWMLEAGRPVEREIAGGASHSYRIALASCQYFHAVVNQRGINLIITLYDPDGRKIADLDSPNSTHGPEPISLIADTPGSYRIEARSTQMNAPKGGYEIRVEDLRVATPQDKIRVAAERAFAEATIIGGQGTKESYRKGIEKYREALPLWHSLGDRQQEAYTLGAIGHLYSLLGEYQQALEIHNRALPLRQAAGDREGEALALYNIGAAYDNLGEPQKSLDFYNRALSINRAINDQYMEAAALGNIGVIYSHLGEGKKALEFFNQALALKRSSRDPYGEATLLNNIGLVHNHLGEQQKALEFFNQAVSIYRNLNYRAGEGTTLNNIAVLYSEVGEYQKALEFLEQVLQIMRTGGNRIQEAITMNNIGVGYGYLGDHRKALDIYKQALPLCRGAVTTEATTLSNIGKTYSDLGEYSKALEFYDQSLSLQRASSDRRGEGVTLTNMGRAYRGLGDHEKALDLFNQSLRIRTALGDRTGETITLYHIARAYQDLNNLTEARARIEAAINIIESLRSKLSSRGLRASYLASVQKSYELHTDILMRLHNQRPSEGFAAAALQTSERFRARILLELLAEARADIREGVPTALIEQERSLQQSLNAKAGAQMRLLSGKHTPEEAAAAAKEIDALTAEYEQVQVQIRRVSPRYAALTQPTTLSLKEIQSKVLDPDTLLLEYALGEEKSYLWAVTPTSLKSFELPGRAKIESAARRVYEILTARNQTVSNETPEQRRRRLELADAEYPKASAALSQMLLGQVGSLLESKRLLIVSDGMLQYLPFAALPKPAVGDRKSGPPRQSLALAGVTQLNQSSSTDYQPLIVDHEVVNLPSASVLATLRRETAGRAAAPKTVAVLADPVFQSDDPRMASNAQNRSAGIEEASESPIKADVRRSAEESGMDNFVRLRFSRREADEIMRLAPDGKKFEALDFAASWETATSADLRQYRIVHFATHGLINSLHPELSGIVLSLVDDQGRPQNGFLRLNEIYNLKLGADLVVLSACKTALGKEYKGEGLVGLTRGFMYAGAPRVMASLWQIDDRITAELMKRFYQGMLVQGLRPAAALRSAQVSMWKDKRWQAPHNWAAFTFQGEWESAADF